MIIVKDATQPSSIGHHKVDDIADIIESISIDDINNAKYGSSFMDDRASIKIDGREYIKIGKNKWQYSPEQSKALGGIYTDNDIYNLIKNSKSVKFSEGIETKSNKYVESLVKISDPEQFGDNCRKAWRVDNQYIQKLPVIIEYREYFDNWNDKLSTEYAVHFDEDSIPEYIDYNEYYFDKLRDAKSYAYELIDECKDYINNECCNNELAEATDSTGLINKISEECRETIENYMKSEGFNQDELNDYYNIDVRKSEDYIIVEVRAELSYEGMTNLSNKLDKYITKYDKDAYFDTVDPGIIEAYIKLPDSMKESYDQEYIDESLLKDLKKGEYFTLKPIDYPKESQVYIKSDYDRSEKKFECIRFDDISYSRLIPPNRKVYTGFTF